MLPYFLMLGIPALAAAFQQESRGLKKSRNLTIDCFFVIWIMLLLLRSIDVGCDLPVYRYRFKQYAAFSPEMVWQYISSGKTEAGCLLLFKAVSLFTSDFQWVMVICALIATVPIWMVYRKSENYPFLTIALFVTIAPFPMFFSGLRQAMAMGICALAYTAAKEKRIWKFVFIVLCATLFHKSAIVFLAFYPLYNMKHRGKLQLLAVLIAAVILMLFDTQIFTVVSKLFGGVYYERYGSGIGTTGAYSVLLLLIMFVVYSFVIPDEELLDDDTVGLRNILVLCMLLQIFSGVHRLTMRLNYYFIIFVPLLIPKIIKYENRKNNVVTQLSVLIMVVFFTVYFFYNAYTGDDLLEIYPYIPFWRQ